MCTSNPFKVTCSEHYINWHPTLPAMRRMCPKHPKTMRSLSIISVERAESGLLKVILFLLSPFIVDFCHFLLGHAWSSISIVPDHPPKAKTHSHPTCASTPNNWCTHAPEARAWHLAPLPRLAPRQGWQRGSLRHPAHSLPDL